MSSDPKTLDLNPATGEVTPAENLPALREAGTLTTGGEAMSVAEFKAQLDDEAAKRKLLVDWIRAQLIPGEDYGIVHRKLGARGSKEYCPNQYTPVFFAADGNLMPCPRCYAKATLRKGGAEKVLSFFKCVARFTLDREGIEAFAAMGLKVLPYICLATHVSTGCVIQEGRGSSTENECQEDPNKAIKMAKKRAMIDAALGFGLSSVFTQDIESQADYDKSNGDGGAESSAATASGREEPATTQRAPSPAPAAAPAEADDRSVANLAVDPDTPRPLGIVAAIQPESEWTPDRDDPNAMSKWIELIGAMGRIYTPTNLATWKWGLGSNIQGCVTRAATSGSGWPYASVNHIRRVKGDPPRLLDGTTTKEARANAKESATEPPESHAAAPPAEPKPSIPPKPPEGVDMGEAWNLLRRAERIGPEAAEQLLNGAGIHMDARKSKTVAGLSGYCQDGAAWESFIAAARKFLAAEEPPETDDCDNEVGF